MIPEPYVHLVIFISLVAISLAIFLINARNSAKRVAKLFRQVKEAEKEAFSSTGDGRTVRSSGKSGTPENVESAVHEPGHAYAISGGSPPAETPTINGLFKLYSDQISKYQEQTQSRATSSFIFAIIAMFAGIIFVFWGGSYILAGKSWEATAAGGIISTIGGTVSAYITKTFLNIHKLSIQQLNRYFQQPVVNDHVVMAQRLAENLIDPAAKQQAYEKIIDRLSLLIVKDAEVTQESAEET